MATIEPIAVPLRASPITSAQPGGGLCMSMELAWGRLRRGGLRRFRPGYVQAMQQKRQGHCPDCPHDIIDPRDLKFFRNVCGHWFRAEDDAFRWRSRIGLARYGLAEVVCFSLLFFVLTLLVAALGIGLHPLFFVFLAPVLVLWLFILSF